MDRLLEVGFIRNVWCSTWISNVVVVAKKKGKWQGIEPNPEKVEVLRNMPSLKIPRKVQVLTGQIAALSWFISRLSDWCKPFFWAIWNIKNEVWGPEQVEAFDQLKRYLTSPSILTIPKPRNMLYMYLAVTKEAVSASLFREENYP
ncbi:hypothetical protein L3X38_012424 [Prunus dulcis]|uniref:Reverse transcriptase/retrotransposon-derived protein RNase H-like domain-containing protein n=1 Tax=Prunus dulcis TaxID=3755 RepID=A0AAD4WLJ2_PRUDU|nr:hypothetical protein L3X38_012424 [Prunus dulcis]